MPRNYRNWTADEMAYVSAHYANTSTDAIADQLGMTVRSVYNKARSLGLSKSVAYLAVHGGRLAKDSPAGVATRFKPGMIPHNKGIESRPGWGPGDMRRSQFKPGMKPHTWVPVGTLRINGDGYLDRKIADDMQPARLNWEAVHRLVWKVSNGPIPAGHAVVFKPGRMTTDVAGITLDALELVTRAELMARNTIQRYPEELKSLIRLKAKLTRKINDYEPQH